MSDNLSLDPDNWDELRAQGHRMLDDMIDHLAQVRERPVWQPIPREVRDRFHAPLPHAPEPLQDIYAEFRRSVAPYSTGNIHPGFMGWVHGGGNAAGMLAEMLAAGLNANLGGRDHMPIVVERQILEWVRELFNFPKGASGLFVTGTSMANFIALLVARTRALGEDARRKGLADSGGKLRAYTSRAAHGCIAKAMDVAGFGTDALRLIATDKLDRIDVEALRAAIRDDRDAGLTPFLVVGTAGSVDAGAVDDLNVLADICRQQSLNFHVDGAFGALAMMSPELAPLLSGIERADSIAFDFHKWAQVPYDAGFVLVRDGALHLRTFDSPATYLRRDVRGLAAGSPWPCDFGPDLSRGFRALKTWFTLKTYGTDRLGAVMAHTCTIARHLERRVRSEPLLELVRPAQLNIVCFRFRGDDALNAELVATLQESGIAAPSATSIDGRVTIRAAIFNHRTVEADVDVMVDAVIETARTIAELKR
ncbi:MAG: pyridoxal phosphate-dependent decarboxylase family protein [Rhizomicrobium sp.]